jgi:hypothetical protein
MAGRERCCGITAGGTPKSIREKKEVSRNEPHCERR